MGKSEVPEVSSPNPSALAVPPQGKTWRKRLADSQDVGPVKAGDKRKRKEVVTERPSSPSSRAGSEGPDPARPSASPDSSSEVQSETAPPRILRSMVTVPPQLSAANGTDAKQVTGSTPAAARVKRDTASRHTAPLPGTVKRRERGTIPSAVTVLFTKLKLKDKNGQVQALHGLHKLVLQEPEMVAPLRLGGVTEWILQTLQSPQELHHTFLTALLDVVNCIVAVSHDEEVQRLVDRDIVTLVLPLCHADNARVRLQALWILGNIGTMFFKDYIVKPHIITSIVQSYDTITQFKAPALSDLRDRYAETIQQLCCGSHRAQLIVLARLLPLVADILDNENRAEAVTGVCEALNHLVDAAGCAAVEVLRERKVVDALIHRLSAGSYGASSCLRSLAFIAACCSAEQVHIVEPVIDYLQKLFATYTPTEPVRVKTFAAASLFVAMISKSGSQQIQLILDRAPAVVPALFDSLVPTLSEFKAGKVSNRSSNAALALMYASQHGSNEQLAFLLGQGVFFAALKILLTFDDIPNLLVQAMKALRRVVIKVENILDVMEAAPDFKSDRYWRKVKGYTQMGLRGGRAGGEAEDSESDTERDVYAKVRKCASRLLQCAQEKGLIS